jgi:hypothetical protein
MVKPCLLDGLLFLNGHGGRRSKAGGASLSRHISLSWQRWRQQDVF